MSIANGIAGKRGYAPKGIMIHNDAGGDYMSASNWESIYKSGKWNFNRGFCHYSIDRMSVRQIEEDNQMAYHCGSYKYNRDFLSCEVCQSMGDKNNFLENEERALQVMAKKCLEYGIVPSKNTIKLHTQVYKTACPHRSVELHGGTIESCQEYFINKLREYMMYEKGNETMECFIEKDKTKYYCNIGSGVLVPLSTNAKYNDMKIMYKANHGKDLVEFKSTENEKWYETFRKIVKDTIKHKQILSEEVAKELLKSKCK